MSDLEQQARAIGLLLGGYGKAKNDENLIEWSNQLLAATLPENQKPQDANSEYENPIAEEILAEVKAEEPEAIEPLTDLTGVDYAPAFEGYQPNGALPETD